MSSKKKATEVTLLPFQQENVATNQQTVPLPFMRGTRLLAVRWMTPALNGIAQPTKGNGKKG